MVKPLKKSTLRWLELVRTSAALMTLLAQGTLIYLYVSSR